VSTTFNELGIPAELISLLAEQGITEPFPIQRLTMADALAGRDLCGKAPTGSGKTLAFALPVALRVDRAAPGRPRALLLVPTRELATQVREVLDPLVKVTGRKVATFYGGTSINRDLQRLRGRLDIAVATPGRLEDLIDRRALSLEDVDLVVLDEADRMADMGFLPVVKRVLEQTRSDRQTLLFSATLDGDVDVLVRHYQTNPVKHEFATPEEARGDVRHVFWAAERADRRGLTAKVLRRLGPSIVFTRTKHGADRLAKQLRQDGVETAAIHGNRSQRQREQALARFSAGRVHTLVATDVAARGIHVDNVAAVVHYDQPATEKDYVHRSGRTGRAGNNGLVVSFVGAEETSEVQKMQRVLALPQGLHDLDLDLLTLEELPAPRPVRHAGGGDSPRQGKGGQRGQRNGQRGAGHGRGGQRNRGRSQRTTQGTAGGSSASHGGESRGARTSADRSGSGARSGSDARSGGGTRSGGGARSSTQGARTRGKAGARVRSNGGRPASNGGRSGSSGGSRRGSSR
jgi:superfamily II DNA/RNA helicase